MPSVRSRWRVVGAEHEISGREQPAEHGRLVREDAPATLGRLRLVDDEVLEQEGAGSIDYQVPCAGEHGMAL